MTQTPLAAVPDPPSANLDGARLLMAQALLTPPDPNVHDEHPVVWGPDGSVTFEAAGRSWTLRAPTLGEFRRLATRAEALRSRAPAKNDAAPDLSARTMWVREVMAMLCDDTPPKTEDLPLWMSNPRLEVVLTSHWLRVPTSAPGSSAPGAGLPSQA